ncbi:hypothetical protein FIBSPDRAFT_842381 [Athelia psychrophila]|uniref:Uncharacterized protein n=1 Tax=Athelia psychrophila TaxID=1759441 RepID=A0A167WJI0_9AGAM|nr:hypothetical protein FIBSPDRAFT_842381 [Fibularhizoctonia sp. CBS 109695]
MRLALLLVITLSLLQSCIASTVSDVAANYASPFPDTTNSLASSNPTSNTCKDLDHCRSLVGIVTSCLATIFACVWVAVHPNIPGPRQNWISKQAESVKLVVVTLLVPEWVLAWAVRQFLQAREYADRLESARKHAASAIQDNQNATHEGNITNASSSDRERDRPPGIRAQEASRPSVQRDRTGELDNEQASNMEARHREAEEHSQLYILALVKSRSLVPPTSDELGDRSTGGALSKTIAILQTLWFVTQCIARRVENLAITNLEIVTLAYTVITVAMYAAWWHKPLNISCPIRVKGDTKIVKNKRRFQWIDIIDYVIGDQDCNISLCSEERVPTFWSSCSHRDSTIPLYADITALSVAMVFGAVHCAAWSYVFPSVVEKWMWRACAIVIAAIPLPMAGAFAVFDPFTLFKSFSAFILTICMIWGTLLYILARIILFVLCFTTLHNLPLSAYQTVQWTTWIPHI